MVGATNNLKNQVDFIIEWRNNTITKLLKKNKMAWVLIISHIGFALWFYAGYKIGKRK